MRFLLASLLFLFTVGGCTQGPKCKKGKPCGETCIDKDKDCKK